MDSCIDKKTRVKISLVSWSAQVEEDLKQCCNSTALTYWSALAENGDCQIWDVSDLDGVHLGTITTLVDIAADGVKELVIGPSGGQWYRAISGANRFLLELAYLHNCERGRVHASSEKIARILSRYDFFVHEYVLHRPVPPREKLEAL